MRLAQKVVLPAALTLLLLGAGAGTALAQAPGDLTTSDRGATTYMSDRYVWQTGWPPMDKVKSFSPWRWASGPNSLRYTTPPPSIADDVRDVVASYNTAFPSMQMVETTPADVTFDTDTGAHCPGFLGCYDPSGFVLAGDAWWPTLGAIHIDALQTQAVIRGTIAHEIGHLYGLDEGYVYDRRLRPDGAWETWRQCNYAAPTSVMDAANCDNLPQAPTALDRQRITTYWTAQAPTVMGVEASGSTTWVHLWKGNGYTETAVEFSAQWWNGSSFVVYDSRSLNEAELSFKWQDWRTAFGVIPTGLPPISPHRMCIRTHSYNFGVDGWSPWGCTEYTSGLVGLWRLDESSGTTAPDASGYGNHGTLVNGPTWMVGGGRVNNALSFDGVDDYVTVADSTSLSFGNGFSDQPFSISLWAKPDVITGKVNGLLSKGTDYNQGEYNLLLEWSRVTFRVIDDSARGMLARNADGAVSTPNFWYHIVGTYDGSRTVDGIKIYVNGVLANSVAAPAGAGTCVAMRDTAYSVSIGDYRTPEADNFDGLLDEVRIYNRALSLNEVQFLYSNPGG